MASQHQEPHLRSLRPSSRLRRVTSQTRRSNQVVVMMVATVMRVVEEPDAFEVEAVVVASLVVTLDNAAEFLASAFAVVVKATTSGFVVAASGVVDRVIAKLTAEVTT